MWLCRMQKRLLSFDRWEQHTFFGLMYLKLTHNRGDKGRFGDNYLQKCWENEENGFTRWGFGMYLVNIFEWEIRVCGMWQKARVPTTQVRTTERRLPHLKIAVNAHPVSLPCWNIITLWTFYNNFVKNKCEVDVISRLGDKGNFRGDNSIIDLKHCGV